MDNAATARQRFTWNEQGRVKDWLRQDHVVQGVRTAWNAILGPLPNIHQGRPVPPIDRELVMAAVWHRTGLLVPFDDDPLQVYLRAVDMPDDGSPWTFEAHPVGRCRRCDASAVPLGDGATDSDSFVEAVALGLPASGHIDVCAGFPF